MKPLFEIYQSCLNQVLSISFLLLIISFGLMPTTLAQTSPQIRFDEANTLLEQQEYRKAIEAYQSIKANGFASGPLFLNLGYSYVQLDSLGKAKYYFMKARRYPATESQASQGLEFVNSKFSRQSAVLPKLPWDRALEWLRYEYGATAVFITGIVLLFLGLLLLMLRWFKGWQHRYYTWTTYSVIGLSLLVVLLGFYVDYRQHRFHKAVMIHEKSGVKEQPAGDAAIVSLSYEGYTFTVDVHRSRGHEGWYYVRMSNGQYGWIPESDILIL